MTEKNNGKIRKGPLFMGDIIGFSNYINKYPLDIIKSKMESIIERIEKISNIEIIRLFEDNRDIQEKLQIAFPKKYGIVGHVISDTILIYPNNDIKETYAYAELRIISSILRAIFEYFLEEKFLIRGVLNYGEYYVSSGQSKSLYGKNVITAHEYEQIQNWSGILLSPNVIEKIKNPDKIESIIRYNDSFIKNELRNEFKKQYGSNRPFVIAWPSVINNFNWSYHYRSASDIQNERIRRSAIQKITNTLRFYDWYNSNYR